MFHGGGGRSLPSTDKLPTISTLSVAKKGITKGKDLKKLPLLLSSKTAPSPSFRRGLGSTTITKAYRYKYYPGNNGRIILRNFQKRPWWHSCGNNNNNNNTVSKSTKQGEHELVDEQINYDIVWEMYRNPKRYKDRKFNQVCLNHLENNNYLVSKKGLYFSIKRYCDQKKIDPLELIPRTFYLQSDQSEESNEELKRFIEFNKAQIPPRITSPVGCTTSDSKSEVLPSERDTARRC